MYININPLGEDNTALLYNISRTKKCVYEKLLIEYFFKKLNIEQGQTCVHQCPRLTDVLSNRLSFNIDYKLKLYLLILKKHKNIPIKFKKNKKNACMYCVLVCIFIPDTLLYNTCFDVGESEVFS